MGDEVSDFFAKKIKKNKKKQKGFTTSQKVAEHVESQVMANAEREKSESQPAPVRPARRTKEDEEWEDFKEESQPDLSGLRIQSLQRRTEGEEGKTDAEENGDEGEKGQEKGMSGPWQVEEARPAPAAEPKPVASSGEATPSQATAGGRYVPPNLRGGAGAASSSSSAMPPTSGKYVPPGVRAAQREAAFQEASAPSGRPGWGRRNVVPDVTSEQSFPSLQESAGIQRPSSKGGYEEVRRGAPSSAPRGHRPNLQLGNKYNALDRPYN